VNHAIKQATTRLQVLVPAAIDGPFTYASQVPLAAGSLVGVNFANRHLVGAVWPVAADMAVPEAKLKYVSNVLDVPPLPRELMQFIDAVASFTLAPLGAVLQLCGLAHAAKLVKRPLTAPDYQPTLPTLSPEQAKAATALAAQKTKPILLDGVTGSGKTEVYFHVIADALAAALDAQILVLLPEISLTHQWIERFTKTFGGAPTVWHSHLTPAQRRKHWQATANGTARVIVGARSALFLPFQNLQLIVVDEEHDPSFKQEDGVLYHARDMAVMRARFAQAAVILSSATPSLETLLNVESGKYIRVELPQRFGVAEMPTVTLIDLLNEPPERGEFLSPTAKQAMLQTLARGEQVLLFLNRRGYAPLLLCRTCGHRFQCDNCSAWMVMHGKNIAHATLQCHHCGTRKKVPDKCPSCEAEAEMFAACGPGIERVTEEVRNMFALDETAPRLVMLSSDEAVAPEQWSAIERGEVDIIIGTQIIAKGHHFPRLTLVIVVDADMGLGGADLRAGERTFQLLHQLGGRAGRAEISGTVMIQTSQPQHPIMQALKRHDRNAVMKLERQLRQQGNWPPYGQLASILLDGVNEQNVLRAAQQLAREAPHDPRITVLGPAPAPLSKLRGQFRFRLLVKADKTIHLQRTLSGWLTGKKFTGVRIKLDVNPYYFL